MKRFITTLFLFGLVLVAVFIAADLALSRWMKASNFPNMEIMNDVMNGEVDADIAVFGSSWPMTGFNPAVCDSITGLSSYDVTTEGGHFNTHRLMEELYFRYNRKPRMIVHFIDSWWLTDNKILGFDFQFLPYMWDKEFRQHAASLMGPVYMAANCIPVLRYKSTSPWLYRLKPRSTYKGHHTYSAPDFNPSVPEDSIRVSTSYRMESEFQKQMARIKEQGISIVFVYQPVHKSYLMEKDSRVHMERFYQDLADKLDIPVLDYRGMDISDDPSKFIDAAHLNPSGAGILTDTLSKDLAGLLGYHVDKSSNIVSGSVTAASVWNSNAVNNYSAHPCCYVVPAGNPTSTTLYSGSTFLFGSSSYTSFTPRAWDGNTTGFALTGITYSNGTVTFNVTNSNTKGITGSVTDTDGHPISGASITVTEAVEASPAPASGGSGIPSKLINKARMLFKPAARKNQPATKAPASYSAVSGSDGLYMIEVPSGTYQVSASAEGYVGQTATVQVTSTIESMSFCLMREGESLPDIIYAWPTDLVTEDDEYMMGAGTNSLTGQNLYPASELAPYLGKQIKEFTFYLVGNESTTYSGVNVIIDYGDNRKATVPVSSSDLTIGGYTTVDLRDLNLVIPANTDIYAGVGFSSGGYLYENNYYFFGGFYKTDENENPLEWAADWPYNGLVSEYNLTSTESRYSWDVLFDFTMKVGDFEAPDTGYNYISDPGNGVYHAGDMFEFNLVETSGSRKPQGAIEWYYDDERVTEPSVMLTYGSHIVEARFTTAEGGTKTVELELSVGQ